MRPYTVQITSSNYADLRTTVAVAGETPEPGPGEGTVTANGEAQVSFGYTAKVSVTYNTADGTIVSVTDNGTEATGANSSFWQNATAMFDKFVGKDRAGVEALKTDPSGEKTDAISGATVSSNAIKEAVLEALPS